jgi:hypothetical protein
MDLRQVRAIVTDSRVLSSLEPEVITRYLERTGWSDAGQRRTHQVWARILSDGIATVVVPNSRAYADYPVRMTELLTTLARVEDRSQLAVLVDLLAGSEGGGSMGRPAVAAGRPMCTATVQAIVVADGRERPVELAYRHAPRCPRSSSRSFRPARRRMRPGWARPSAAGSFGRSRRGSADGVHHSRARDPHVAWPASASRHHRSRGRGSRSGQHRAIANPTLHQPLPPP